MNKKIIITILVVIILVVSIVFFLREKTDKNEESEKTTYVKKEVFDYSGSLDNIDTIKGETITEARIYSEDKIYRTTDKEIIEGLVDKISSLELEEISGDRVEQVEGYYELFLLNDNKVVYYFLSADYLSVGKNYYGPKEQVLKFNDEVMGYCRKTFWNE